MGHIVWRQDTKQLRSRDKEDSGTHANSPGEFSEIKAGTHHAVREPKIRSRAVGASVTYIVDVAKW